MWIEYKLKGVNPNGISAHTYQGLFRANVTNLRIELNPGQSKDRPVYQISGNDFNYFSSTQEDLMAVYEGLKKSLLGIESKVLDLGFIKPMNLT